MKAGLLALFLVLSSAIEGRLLQTSDEKVRILQSTPMRTSYDCHQCIKQQQDFCISSAVRSFGRCCTKTSTV